MNQAVTLPLISIETPLPGSSVRVVSSVLSPVNLITFAWRDLLQARDLELLTPPCAYVMVGVDADGQLRARAGEAVKPWPRLDDHNYTKSLNWVERAYLITSAGRAWDKAQVVALQEVVSDAIKHAERAQLHALVGPLRFPISAAKRHEARVLIEHARLLMEEVGCLVLSPATAAPALPR